MSVDRPTALVPLRRRAYSTADVQRLAARARRGFSASEPVAAAQRPMFVANARPASSDDAFDDALETSFEESSESTDLSGRQLSSPLARSSATVRTRRTSSGGDRLRRTRSHTLGVGRSYDSERAGVFSLDDSSVATSGDCSSSSSDERPRTAARTLQRPASERRVARGLSVSEANLRGAIAAVHASTSKRRLWRKPSTQALPRLEEETGDTLIYYWSHVLICAPPRLFRVPDAVVDSYMRTCLMRAHASTIANDPFRECACGAGALCAHELPDAAAKFAAVYVLDPTDRTMPARYRAAFDTHRARDGPCAGVWAKYEASIGETHFAGTEVRYVYTIRGFA